MQKFMKKYLNIIKEERGQSMVEFAVVLPVLLLFFYCITYLSDIYIIKQNALAAARYSAWKLARPNPPTCPDLESDISDFFFEGAAITLDCSPSSGDSNGFLGDAGPAAKKILNNIIGSASDDMSHAKVDHPVPVPLVLASLDPTNTLSNITISGEHFVEGNAWSGFEVDTHDVFDMIKNIFQDLIDIV